MPEFNCPDCDESFNSRRKRNEHMQAAHETSGETGEPLTSRLTSAVTDRKKASALIFGLTMVGLPFGGALFYASVGPSTGGSGGGSSGTTYTSQPPVGYGTRQLPQPDGSPPSSAVVTDQLSDRMQVYLLLQGGPEEVGRRGLKPAVLLQYSCTNCPGTVQTLEAIAGDINPRSGGNWVYVAPYREMNSTVAVSAFRTVSKYDTAEQQTIRSTVCRYLQQQPLACLSDQLDDGGNATGS